MDGREIGGILLGRGPDDDGVIEIVEAGDPGPNADRRNDFFLRPKIAYDLADGWRATVGGEVFHGPKHSFFGRIERNTGAFVELMYSF